MENSTENLSIGHFLGVIKEYESLSSTLQEEIRIYKEKQLALKGTISSLVKDNQVLSKQLNELIDEKINNCDELESKSGGNDAISNLKLQLELTLKEKEAAIQLWQSSLQAVDHLEAEIKWFSTKNPNLIPAQQVNTLKKKYDKIVNELTLELSILHETVQKTINDSVSNLKTKNADLEDAVRHQKKTLEVVHELETEIKALQEHQKDMQQIQHQLQEELQQKHFHIERLKLDNLEAKFKVNEAVNIVDMALKEKTQLKKEMEDVVKKAEKQVEDLKKGYEEKLDSLSKEVKKLQEEGHKKAVEAEMRQKEGKLLEEQLERLKKYFIPVDDGNTSKLLILEKNLEATFQKLLLSEKKVCQITAERDSVRSDLEQMASHFERDIKARNIERKVLEHKISNLQKELETSNANFLQTVEKVNEFQVKIHTMDLENRNKLQMKIRSYESKIVNKLKETTENHNKIQNELEEYLETQINLNQKWKIEVKQVINQLESLVCELQATNKELKHENKGLKKHLKDTTKFQENLIQICNDLTDITGGVNTI